MDAIREQINKPWVIGAVCLVVGLVVGLVVLGWGLFPLQWTDGTPAQLRSDLQQDYLRMTIDSYTKNQDKSLALQRWESLGPKAANLLVAVQSEPGSLTPADISSFSAAVEAGLVPPVAAGTSTSPEAGAKTGAISPAILAVMFLVFLAVGGGLGYVFVIRNKRPAGEPGAEPTAEMANKTQRAFHAVTPAPEPPVAQFMTTYMAGDDQYDDSFSIDSPAGEFLGECGVGISETIGVGDPKKVTAFEVWLFDKNDIQTVTKVLMSEHAFGEVAIRQKLESKGEPIMTEPGKRILLETATLQLEARVVDMNYGQGALPSCSHFDRLTLELAIWPKPQTA